MNPQEPSVAQRISRFFAGVARVFQGLLKLPAKALRLQADGKNAPLYTKRVKAQLALVGVVLLAAFGVEIWAWSHAFAYGVSGGKMSFIALTLGLALATGILIYDILAFLADPMVPELDDPDRKKSFLGWMSRSTKASIIRLSIAFGASAITAVPASLVLFEDEINVRMDRDEKKNVDAIREKTIAEAKQKYQARLDDQSGTKNAELEAKRADLEKSRAAMLETHGKRREVLQKAYKDAQDRAGAEAIGNGPSRTYGIGSVYRQLAENERQAKADLDAFEVSTQAELKAFDEDMARAIAGYEKSRGDAKRSGDRELDQEIEKIKAMPADKLAALNGGSWKVARGFLQRKKTLDTLCDEDATIRTMVLASHAVFWIFGILVIAIKGMLSQALKRALSEANQAAAGNEEVRKSLEAAGITDVATYALAPFVREFRSQHRTLCEEAVASVQRLRALAHTRSRMTVVRTGLHQTRHEIVAELHAAWKAGKLPDQAKPVEAFSAPLDRLSVLESRMRGMGIEIPAWPQELGGEGDVRAIPPDQLWDLTAGELANTYGWRDPSIVLDAASYAAANYPELQRALRDAFAAADHQLEGYIGSNAGAARSEISRFRNRQWENQILPILDRLAASERDMAAALYVPAPWPREFPDPRNEKLRETFLRVSDETLMEYGWLAGVMPRASSTTAN
jgi:hypothetical protein